MGNVEGHNFPPIRADERKALDLSHKVNLKQYLKHLNGKFDEKCLKELPWNLRDCVSLYESMDVSFNALTEIPVELPLRLPHLSHLDLSHNQLHNLPQSFGLLFHLKEVSLQHNYLSSLPESFISLFKLKKIDISHNYLVQLPADIGSMECLERVNLTHNKLKVLPLSLGSPSCHVNLLLAQRNRLESPPQAVCDEGSASTLEYIRKQYINSHGTLPLNPTIHLNVFPRCCGNKSEPSVTNPHSAQIQYIQEQTNTTHTTNRVKAPLLPPVGATTLSPFQLRDRIIGLIYGAAIGDAVGVSCRWMSPDECAFHYGSDEDLLYSKIVQDEHRVLWRRGSWTSNFDQLVLVLDSLVNWAGVVDELEFARRLQVWGYQGFPELSDFPGVITNHTVRKAVTHPDFSTDPHRVSILVLHENRIAEDGVSIPGSSTSSEASSSLSSVSSESAPQLVYIAPSDIFGQDNAALVRTPVLGVPNFQELVEVESNAVRICKTTHSDSKCVASCVFISLLVSLLLQGKLVDIEQKEKIVCEEHLDIAFQRAATQLSDKTEREAFLSLKEVCLLESLNAREAFQMSHTYKPVRAALAGLHWKGDFGSFITALTKLGGDSSSNACVAGAVLGCCVGYSHLPQVWVDELCQQQVHWLNSKINHLLDIMGSP